MQRKAVSELKIGFDTIDQSLGLRRLSARADGPAELRF
jgi:hypothetical protein